VGRGVDGERKYTFLSLLVLIFAFGMLALRFERRRPQARELVLLAALSSIAWRRAPRATCCRRSSRWARS
jgi:hypothetical protein